MSKREADDADISMDDEIFNDAMKAFEEVSGKSVPSEDGKQTDTSASTAAEKPAGDTPARGPGGRFAKKETTPDADKEAPDAGTTKVVDAAQKPDEGKPDGKTPDAAAQPAAPVGPPPSYSVKTKADWNNLPQHVRDDIIKREQDAATGLAALKDFKDLKPWADMARQHNTTINDALKNYVGIENLLKQDFGKGIAQLCQNFGMSQEKAAGFFAEMAAKFGHKGAGPAGGGGSQPATSADPFANPTGDPLLDALRPVLQPLFQQVNEVKTHLTTQQTAQTEAGRRLQEQQAMSRVEQAFNTFAADPNNRFINELQETMIKLLETGMVPRTGDHAADLRTAYDTAAQLHPEVREALIEQRLAADAEARRKKEQEAADKAKAASRSIAGSRIPGTQIREPVRTDSTDDIEADVRAAYASARHR